MSGLQEWLVGIVRDSGKSQAWISEEVGITQKHMSQIMTGKAEGSLRLWSDILDAVGVHIAVEVAT